MDTIIRHTFSLEQKKKKKGKKKTVSNAPKVNFNKFVFLKGFRSRACLQSVLPLLSTN